MTPFNFNISIQHLKDSSNLKQLENELTILSGDKVWKKVEGSESSSLVPESHGISIVVWKPEFQLNTTDISTEFRFILHVEACINSLDHKSSFIKNIEYCHDNPLLNIINSPENKSSINVIKTQLEFWYIQMSDISSELISTIKERFLEIFSPPLNQSDIPEIKGSLDIKNILDPAF